MEQQLFSWLTPEEVQAWDNFYYAHYEDQMTTKLFFQTLHGFLQNDEKWKNWALDFVCNYLIHSHTHDYGPLVSIFEDLRFTDDEIAYCQRRADERGDSSADVILTILHNMSMLQRRRMLRGFPFGKSHSAQAEGWRRYFQEWKRIYAKNYPVESTRE